MPERSSLTDAWLVYVEDLKNLKTLLLYNMAITTNGLHHLRALSNLTTLSLHGTRLTSILPSGPAYQNHLTCVSHIPRRTIQP